MISLFFIMSFDAIYDVIGIISIDAMKQSSNFDISTTKDL